MDASSDWAEATVKTWDDELGWGIVAAPDVAGEIWVHFSAIEGDGYRSLKPGGKVSVRYTETPGSPDDLYGCEYMAESAVEIES
jgi:CspA family cold shock protein